MRRLLWRVRECSLGERKQTQRCEERDARVKGDLDIDTDEKGKNRLARKRRRREENWELQFD